MQTFLGFNATAHSMVATALGNRRSKEGAEILVRICELAVALSLPLMTVLFITRSTLPGLFTSDMAVVTEVAHVLPFLLLCMVRFFLVCGVALNNVVVLEHINSKFYEMALFLCSHWMLWAYL